MKLICLLYFKSIIIIKNTERKINAMLNRLWGEGLDIRNIKASGSFLSNKLKENEIKEIKEYNIFVKIFLTNTQTLACHR